MTHTNRAAVVTANGRSAPALMCPIEETTESNMVCNKAVGFNWTVYANAGRNTDPLEIPDRICDGVTHIHNGYSHSLQCHPIPRRANGSGVATTRLAWVSLTPHTS